MTYYLYHIPGKKVGVTTDLKRRVEDQQGYGPDEYDIIMKSDNIEYVSKQEIYLQKMYGYRVDETPYNELKFNTKEMNINITMTHRVRMQYIFILPTTSLICLL